MAVVAVPWVEKVVGAVVEVVVRMGDLSSVWVAVQVRRG